MPDPKDYGAHANWVWGEGIPDDMPVFEGHRVVLLGPPSYSRSWRSQRMFDRLKASLDCTQLSRAEVKAWLERIAAANQTNQTV